jgi:hypothetical protein
VTTSRVLFCLFLFVVGVVQAGICDQVVLPNDGRTFNWCIEYDNCSVVIKNEDQANTKEVVEIFNVLSSKGCGLLTQKIKATAPTTKWFVTYVVPSSPGDLLMTEHPVLRLNDGTILEATDWLTSEEVDGKPAQLECVTRDIMPGWLYEKVAKLSRKGNFWTILGFPRSYPRDGVPTEWTPADVAELLPTTPSLSSAR